MFVYGFWMSKERGLDYGRSRLGHFQREEGSKMKLVELSGAHREVAVFLVMPFGTHQEVASNCCPGEAGAGVREHGFRSQA